jgi:hypothetical protein
MRRWFGIRQDHRRLFPCQQKNDQASLSGTAQQERPTKRQGHWPLGTVQQRQAAQRDKSRETDSCRPSIMIERQEAVEGGLVLLVRDKPPHDPPGFAPDTGLSTEYKSYSTAPPLPLPLPPHAANTSVGMQSTTRLSGPPPQRLIPPGLRPRIRGSVCARIGKQCALTCRLLSGAMGPVEAPSVYRGMSRRWLRAASDGSVDLWT